MNKLLLLFIIKLCYCDWVSEWLTPLQYQYKEIQAQYNTNTEKKNKDEDITPINEFIPQASESELLKPNSFNEYVTSLTLKSKLEEILKTATALSTALKIEIDIVKEREHILKETIVNGKYGITALTVTTIDLPPRRYLIRNGLWSLCNGMVQYPTVNKAYNIYSELLTSPRCIGQEVPTKRDPCVFNSVIKYETVPVTRRSFYTEDNYLCLKTSFNNTIENYMTVPKRVVDETCKNGTITSLTNNILNCGQRVLAEYTYYPFKEKIKVSLPTQYCSEKDGSCNLMIGWHISNKSIENFEFLKNDRKFKHFFIKKKNFFNDLFE